MKYEVYKINKIKDKDNNDIYERGDLIQNISAFEWSDNKKDQFLSFNFTTNQKLATGDEIELYSYTDRKTVFFGKIEKEDLNEKSFQYSGYDNGYSLLKKTTTIQYNATSVQDAIRQVCTKNELSISTINIETEPNIEKIYRNETIHDVLNDIYKIAVEKNLLEDNYYYNCKNGLLELCEYAKLDTIQGYTGGRYKINSFEYVISVDGKTWDKKKQIEFKDGSTLKVFADYKLHTGIYTRIKNDVLKMNDVYLVTSSKHSIEGGLEKVDVTLVKFNPFKQEPESTKQEEIPPKKETEDL